VLARGQSTRPACCRRTARSGTCCTASSVTATPPTPLQLLSYVGYLAIVVVVYLGVRGKLAARAERPHATA